MEDADYVANMRSDMVYVSRPFKIGQQKDRDAHYVKRVFEEGDRSAFDYVDGEIVIRATNDDKVQVKAVVTTDDRKIRQLTLQSFRLYKKEGWRPNEQFGINLYGAEIERLIEFIQVATKLDMSVPGRIRLDKAVLSQLDLDEAAKGWLASHPDALQEIVRSQITTRDVVAVAYRRRQLETFERLLSDGEYFDRCVAERGLIGREEALWQAFFEENRWIFGYGLFHLSASGFTGEKLEQIVAGAAISTNGKRIDGLLRTRGRVSSLCLVEIKRHRTALLTANAYRPGAWQPSRELSGAVAQILSSIDGAERQFQQLFIHKDDEGNPTGEAAVVARPRAVIICGTLNDFATEHGINHDKFRSFELFRRHLVTPDVVTFDELLERARMIVEADEVPPARTENGL
jgi:hypothetical protein